MRIRLRFSTKGPLAVAALIAVPLYFAALMASSLAIDTPHIVGRRVTESTGSTEAKVWLAALIAPAILIAVGVVASVLRRHGLYLVAATGMVLCFVLPALSNNWLGRHERRFPQGIDFIRDSDPSNLASRGEWEQTAQSTVTSITHWTLGLAIGAIVVGLLLEIRRRRGATTLLVGAPPTESTTGGAPQITG